MNIILASDSYKLSMAPQYPPGTEYVYDYIESRTGGVFTEIVTAGVNQCLIDYLANPITLQDIIEAEVVLAGHGVPFFKENWMYILEKHNGYLPLEIRARPEGSVYPCGTPLVTVVNTDPNCYWLTTHVETFLLRSVWYMSTVATISFNIKQDLKVVMEKTCDTLDKLPFMLHDFGARGVSSGESAGNGDLAHMYLFMGTDTLEGLLAAKRIYGYVKDAPPAGFSIPAMEHSTVTSWGKDGEVEAYKNMLDTYAKPGALLACVSDSYDLSNANLNIWGGTLAQQVIDSGATVVVRPDSGDPATIVLRTIEELASKFGYTVNTKGYKLLNNVRVIQGDGVDRTSINDIMSAMIDFGWSIDNIAFGMGGALLQQCDRDWGRWAMKCSAIKIGGKWKDVYKQPKTDMTKASKRGRFFDDDLITVYKNGEILTNDTLEDVRARVDSNLL